MKLYYDNCSIASEDLDGVAKAVSDRLKVPLQEEEDSDFGGRYHEFHSEENWVVRLFLNWNPLFEDWVDWQFRNHPIILQVFDAPRNFEFEKELNGIENFDITLLERSVYDTETEEFETITGSP
ncbi:MAG: hypothetical protein GY953_38390 [bacterium]|nr:hypothetical protein [bacterium]